MHRACTRVLFLALLVASIGTAARGQNPVQWSGDTRGSVSLAKERSLPLLFWVSGGRDADNDDLEDAQEECFRDPGVVDYIKGHYVPVRVSRSSNVVEAARSLGLPTEHGLYCAVLTPDGKLVDSMGPGEVSNPAVFAAHLRAAYAQYCDDLYETELRPVLEDQASPKPEARRAAQTVWRLEIRKADRAMIGLLERPDLTPAERSRLYPALAALGTGPCTAALLESADPKAAAALLRAPPGVLEWIIPELPGDEGEVTAKQMAAYRAAMQISRYGSPRPEAWWKKATTEERHKELARLKERSLTVLEFSREHQPAER
ncbi:MAG: hypothetical protein IT436_11425 [Phycisphaerales bacterium]|nr:hypothetical protein [Phycisphaerales bacterium]